MRLLKCLWWIECALQNCWKSPVRCVPLHQWFDAWMRRIMQQEQVRLLRYIWILFLIIPIVLTPLLNLTYTISTYTVSQHSLICNFFYLFNFSSNFYNLGSRTARPARPENSNRRICGGFIFLFGTCGFERFTCTAQQVPIDILYQFWSVFCLQCIVFMILFNGKRMFLIRRVSDIGFIRLEK